METMTAKEFLRQYEYADRKVRRLKAEYEREHELIGNISVNIDGMPHGFGVSRKVENEALKLAEKAARWKEAELDAIRIRQEVFEKIYDIPGIEGDILIERYINLHKWEEICVLVHYSWHGVHTIHRRALAIVERALNGTQ